MRRLIATLVSSSNVRGGMKSTYFLPGRYWDNKPLYKGKIDVGCAACYYDDVFSPIIHFLNAWCPNGTRGFA